MYYLDCFGWESCREHFGPGDEMLLDRVIGFVNFMWDMDKTDLVLREWLDRLLLFETSSGAGPSAGLPELPLNRSVPPGMARRILRRPEFQEFFPLPSAGNPDTGGTEKEDGAEEEDAEQIRITEVSDDFKRRDGQPRRARRADRGQDLGAVRQHALYDAAGAVEDAGAACGRDAVPFRNIAGDGAGDDDRDRIVGGETVHDADQEEDAEFAAAPPPDVRFDGFEQIGDAAVVADDLQESAGPAARRSAFRTSKGCRNRAPPRNPHRSKLPLAMPMTPAKAVPRIRTAMTLSPQSARASTLIYGSMRKNASPARRCRPRGPG